MVAAAGQRAQRRPGGTGQGALERLLLRPIALSVTLQARKEMVQTRAQLRKASNDSPVRAPSALETPEACAGQRGATVGGSVRQLGAQLAKAAGRGAAVLEARPAALQWLALVLFLFAATTTFGKAALGLLQLSLR